MQTLPPDELLPVLVADLADDEARDVFEAAAASGRQVWVPLASAPVHGFSHVLEVHTPSHDPFFYICQPLGPPTADGFPLRIERMPNSAPAAPRVSAGPVRDVLRGRSHQVNITLSESHTNELSHVGPLPTEDGPDPKIGRALAGGKLVIEQLIGQGGVGAVYKARHRELKMAVAVKVLHESFQNDIDFCRRFYAEALAASRLDHPNVTRVIDFGQEPDGQFYFAMEFLDGVELRSVIEKEGKVLAPRIAALMMQVCAGLSHAHARGVVHRDIKPENLVLVAGHDDDGQPTEVVKVCDFGLAQHHAGEADGTVSGTPEYMSPEQCRADELDARSDLYSCGVIMYELATGQLPFITDKPMKLLNMHQFTAPTPPSKLDPRIDPTLEAIILKALAKDPDDRYASMRDLRAALRVLVPSLDAPPSSIRELPTNEEFRPTPRAEEPSSGHVTAARKAPESPAWLERGGAYSSGSANTGAARKASPPGPPSIDRETLSQNATAWMTRLAQTPDPKVFAQGAQKLETALRQLAQYGDVDTLWRISSTMHGIAAEGTAAVGSRAWSASKFLRAFDDPTILAHVAEQVLVGPPDAREKARRLLMHAGVAGAYGLYGARVKLARSPAIRPLFVTMLREFGPKAWPVVKPALEKIAATAAPNAGTVELAEDLLACVATAGDESAGHVVLKFLRWTHSGVCRTAAAAVIKLWGDRARPVFVAMVQSKDDVVCITGIAGLRQLGAIDEHLVPRFHAILTGRVAAGDDVRAAAAVALAHASESARKPAVSLLAQLLTPQRDGALPAQVQGKPTASLTKQDAVVIAMARSLLAIGGKTYRSLIAERAERSPEPLRGQLKGLLSAP